jgi:hypothetical protein
MAESFTVQTEIEGDSDWKHEFEGGGSSQTITIAAPTDKPAELEFDTVLQAGSSGSASIYLSIQSVNFPDVSSESEPIDLTLNEEPAGDKSLTILDVGEDDIKSPGIVGENPSSSGHILVRPDHITEVNMKVFMIEAGKCTTSDEEIANTDDDGWSIELKSSATSPQIKAGKTTTFKFHLKFEGTPLVTGPGPEFRFTATHSETGESIPFSNVLEVLSS